MRSPADRRVVELVRLVQLLLSRMEAVEREVHYLRAWQRSVRRDL